jgi:hypothetical protein
MGSTSDWAERIAAEVCKLLGLPHANYELAVWRDRPGVVTPLFVPDDGRLILGNELLGRLVKDYDGTQTYEQRQHRVSTVMGVLRRRDIFLLPPAKGNPDLERACDLFCGYLMLDALIGNTDRHHENWGLVRRPPGTVELAPTFDHASSLGRNESDENRARRLDGRDRAYTVARYAARARSALYGSGDERPLLTIDAFFEAAKLRPVAGKYWLNVLLNSDCAAVESILSQVPSARMSDAAKRFAMEMLRVNKSRLLERHGDLP